MSDNLFTLVTQSFGRENEYKRVILAILSFYTYADQNTPTILFTDKPEYFHDYFDSLPVSYVLLTPEKIGKMRGEIDFLHRMKIALIEEAMEMSKTNILYADSDTFFLKAPNFYTNKISVEKSFMHIHEYEFETVRDMPLPAGKAARAFVKYIEQNEVFIPNTKIKIITKMSSWNAGVMLIHKDNSILIEKVYQLTDLFFPACKSHASEQYAFSIVLQSLTKVESVEDMIYHYWYNIKKKVVDQYLSHNLESIKSLDLAGKLDFVKKAIPNLLNLFTNHIDVLKDNAIQAFNDRQYALGLSYSFKAFRKGGLKDAQFIRDVLYHTKNKLIGR